MEKQRSAVVIGGWWTIPDDFARGAVVFEFDIPQTELVGVVVEEGLGCLGGGQIDWERSQLEFVRGIAGPVWCVMGNFAEHGVGRPAG